MLASCSRIINAAKTSVSYSLKKEAWVCKRCRYISLQADAETSDVQRRSTISSPSHASLLSSHYVDRLAEQKNLIPQNLLDRYNNQMEARAEAGRVADVLKLCVLMKTSGIRPNRNTYNSLLQAFASSGLQAEALATIHDMKAMGIPPDVEEYNYLLNSLRFSSSHAMCDVFDIMLREGVEPDATTYTHLIRRYISGGNLELAMQILAQMNSHSLMPPQKTAQTIICEALSLGYARLAFDISESFEQISISGLDSEVWTKLLIGCAQSLYADGVERCWNRVVTDFKITPDEGLCLDVLHTASRHGLPMLAASALQQLETRGIIYKEHHLAPLLESFAVSGQIKEAFQVLQLLRLHNIEASQETIQPLLRLIRMDPDAVDSAWMILEELRKDEEVDILAANVIIEAAVFLGDLQRTIGILKSMPSFGLTPNVKTYILLLSACVKARHRDLGDKIWRDMKAASISPNAEAYEALITLCLTQPAYEDAFFYLEEMKEHQFKPSYTLYDTLIRKCIENGDTRYKLALDELKNAEYKISRRLSKFIANGGEAVEGMMGVDTDNRSTSNERSRTPAPL